VKHEIDPTIDFAFKLLFGSEGGGVKPGLTFGETDEFGYNVTRDPAHVHNLQATMLHLLGIDHTKLTYKYQGRHLLTDVHGGMVRKLLAKGRIDGRGLVAWHNPASRG
jgi:hypothetical protein